MAWINETKPNTTWSDGIEYLVSEALKYLMTEDNKYIITNQSFNAKPNTAWVNQTL